MLVHSAPSPPPDTSVCDSLTLSISVVKSTLSFADLSADTIIGDAEAESEFRQDMVESIAVAAEVAEDQVTLVSLLPGSLVAEFFVSFVFEEEEEGDDGDGSDSSSETGSDSIEGKERKGPVSPKALMIVRSNSTRLYCPSFLFRSNPFLLLCALAGASVASSAFVTQLQSNLSSVFNTSRFGSNTQSLSIAVGEEVITIQSSDSPSPDITSGEDDEEDDGKISLGFAELDPPVLISLG